jgi:hypothetical protein
VSFVRFFVRRFVHSCQHAVVELVGIGIAFSKYIKQNQVPAADERSTVLQRCYTINIMLMKHMTLFSLKQLTVYQDSSETM